MISKKYYNCSRFQKSNKMLFFRDVPQLFKISKIAKLDLRCIKIPRTSNIINKYQRCTEQYQRSLKTYSDSKIINDFQDFKILKRQDVYPFFEIFKSRVVRSPLHPFPKLNFHCLPPPFPTCPTSTARICQLIIGNPRSTQK